MSVSRRIFLLSPASLSGERSRLVFSDRAQSSVAVALRTRQGVPLGEVFGFLSGLYFRGKLVYATTFANPPAGVPGVLVITTCGGLMVPSRPVTLRDLEKFGKVPIDLSEPRYRRPLARDAQILREAAGGACEVVLLGSVATGKYVDILLDAFGDRLRFPAEFVGRGDMSRGGLLLRAVADRRELEYIPIAGAQRHGRRPPRLERRKPGLLAAVLRTGAPLGAAAPEELAPPPAERVRPVSRSRRAPRG